MGHGREARLCMNILMFPEHLPFETVQAILRGGYDKVAEAEAIVVGGHTIKDDIPKYGLCVSGVVHPDCILRNNSIQKGRCSDSHQTSGHRRSDQCGQGRPFI